MSRSIFAAAFASALTLLATPACADDFFAANTHVLVGEEKVITAEYVWSEGDLSGYGYVDKSLDNDFVITDHEVRLATKGPFYISAELGYNRFGGEMGKVGAGVHLGNLPGIRDTFAYMDVYAQHTVFGPDADRIVGGSFSTKDVRLMDGVSVYVSGFADFKHNAPDVIQPQVWVKFDNSPFEVGAEASIFGGEASYFATLKLKL